MVRMRLHTKRMKRFNQLGAGNQKLKELLVSNAIIDTLTSTTQTLTTAGITTANITNLNADSIIASKSIIVSVLLSVGLGSTLNGAVHVPNTLSANILNISGITNLTGALTVAGATTLGTATVTTETVNSLTVRTGGVFVLPRETLVGATGVTIGTIYASNSYLFVGISGSIWKSTVVG